MVLFCFSSFSLYAKTLTALCDEPIGYALIDFMGKTDKGEDNISGSKPKIIWDMETKKATVIVQHTTAIGGGTNSMEGIILMPSDEQVTIVTSLEDQGVAMYSLFLNLDILISTEHKNGLMGMPGGAVGKMYRSNCKININ